MSLLRTPRRVCLGLEKIQRDFLCGGGSLESKPHLVKWAIVCLDKRNGGLGVRCLHSLNIKYIYILMGKHRRIQGIQV